MKRAAVVLLSALVAACGAASPPVAPADASKASSDDSGRIRALEQTEDDVLRDLAAIDRRIGQRARVVPREQDTQRIAMAAVLAEDPSVAVIDGIIDPFSFDARARGLAAVKKRITALPSKLPSASSGMTASPALERDLLVRVVDEEVARLDEERVLPRSASALVRAVVATWPPPTTEQAIAERDRWLARRLTQIRDSLAKTKLDAVRARDLDDALDALERIVGMPGFQKATAELVRVRDTLEAQGTQPPLAAHSEWSAIEGRLRAHLGLAERADDIDRELEDAEKDLKTRADAAIARANVAHDVLVSRLAAVVFAPGECVDAVPGSRVRSMAAPPERAASCQLRHLVATAHDDASRAIALAAMHDHVIVARWAVDVSRGSAALAQTTARHPLIALASPDTQARLERIAQARPVMAIGAGETARMLLADQDPAEQARRWNALGDVPLDVARRELAGK